jgi:hypothetical protein
MAGNDDARAYRVRAQHCLEIAQDLGDTSRRMILLDMAQAWIRLAEQAARNQRTNLVYETPRRSAADAKARTEGP